MGIFFEEMYKCCLKDPPASAGINNTIAGAHGGRLFPGSYLHLARMALRTDDVVDVVPAFDANIMMVLLMLRSALT